MRENKIWDWILEEQIKAAIIGLVKNGEFCTDEAQSISTRVMMKIINEMAEG